MNFFNALYFKALTTLTGTTVPGDSVNSVLGEDAQKVEKIVNTALNFVIWISLLMFVVLLAIAGAKIMISNQNAEEVQKSRQGIKHLIFGAFVCGFASLGSVLLKTFFNHFN